MGLFDGAETYRRSDRSDRRASTLVIEIDGYKSLDEGQAVEFDVAPGRKGDEEQNVRVV